MDVVIVDDEALARSRLSRMMMDLGHEVLGEAANAHDGLDVIQKNDPSIVFLDIQMPGESGLDLAKRLAELDAPPAIVFTTAHEKFALEAFGVQAAGYLLKPIRQEQLQRVLDKAQLVNRLQLQAIQPKSASSQRSRLTVNTHRGIEILLLENIRCFIAGQKYVTVFHVEGETIIDETLKELEEEFSPQFTRIHRNALVGLQYVEALNRDSKGHFSLRLRDINFTPSVSRRYQSHIRALLDSRS